MRKKIQSRKGFTLIELLAAVIILVLLVIGITTSMNAATRIYSDSTFESDSAALAGIANTALEDLLRYADLADMENEHLITNRSYGATKGNVVLENGFLSLVSGSSSRYLVNPGAYPNLAIQDFSIDFDENSSTYTVKYKIVSTGNADKVLPVEFNVRSANVSEAYYNAAEGEGGVANSVKVFLSYQVSGTMDPAPFFYVPGTRIDVRDWDSVVTSTIRAREAAGHEFLGWFDRNGVEFDHCMAEQDLYLSAHWKTDAVTVEYYVDGSLYYTDEAIPADGADTVTFDPYTLVRGGNAGLKLTRPSTDYHLKNDGTANHFYWYKNADCSDASLVGNSYTASTNDTVRLYARWEKNVINYKLTITYDPNGGSGSKVTREINTNAPNFSLERNTFSWVNTINLNCTAKKPSKPSDKIFYSGYITEHLTANYPNSATLSRQFVGWADSQDGPSVYFDAASFSLAEAPYHSSVDSTNDIFASEIVRTLDPITLYAVWDAPSALVLPSPGTYETGLKGDITGSISSRAEWHCIGWTDSSDSNTPKYFGSYQDIAAPGTVVSLYAIWDDINAKKVTLHNYPEVGQSDELFTDSIIVLPDSSQNGKHIVWHKDSLSGSVVSSGSNSVTANTDFYAQWVPNTITYYNGSSVFKKDTYQTGYKLIAVPAGTYLFRGWALTPDETAGEGIYAAGTPFIPTEYNVNLYARWQYYTVTFDPNAVGVTCAKASETAPTVTLPDASRVGYRFDGWYTAASGGTLVGKAGDTYTPTGNVTLYAHWTVNTYDVKYTADGSNYTSLGSYTYSITEDTYITLPNNLTKPGYTFRSWLIEQNSTPFGAQVNDNMLKIPVRDSGDIKLKAEWMANPYTVTFDPEGGSVSPTSTTVTYNSTYGTLPTPVRTGYTFAGWYTAASGGSKVTASSDVKITADQTLYAHWTAKTYTVTYKGNEGKWSDSAAEKNITVTYDAKYILPENNPTRTGYIFKGWFTAPSGGSQVTAETTVKITAAQVLHAQWEPITYTIAFNGNGGSGTMNNVTGCIYDTEITLPANSFTRTGYTFDGWAKTAVGGKAYADSAKVKNLTATDGATVTLYAHWTANTYTVIYNGNNGKWSDGAATKNVTVTYDAKYILPANNPARAGYTFTGWFTDASGGTQVTASSDVKITANQTLYAHWTPITYTIAFNGNGSTSGSTASKTGCKYDADVTLTANGFSRTGYTFAGWNTKADGTGTSYANGASVKNLTATNGATVTLYAKWTANTYTVSFVGNGATGGSMSNESFTYDADAKALPDNTFSKTGYSFNGWNTKADGTGTSYTDKQSVKNLTAENGATVTLYAKWSINQYTITFKDGDSTISTIKQNYGTDVTAPANPTKTGYTFAGWDKEIPATMPAENMTITAKWTANNYTLTLDANGGTVTSPISYTIESTSTLPTPTRNGYMFGYTFKEWNVTTAAGSWRANATFNAGTSLNGKYGNATLTAQWTANEYNIKDSDTGTVVGKYTVKTVNQNVTLTQPTKDGYKFTGWTVSSGYSISGNTLTIPANTYGEISVKSNWELNQYTVTYNANGGSVTPESAKVTVGQSCTLPTPNAPTGYTFDGWYTASTGGSKVGNAGANYKPTASITLYAQWTAKIYTITVSIDGNVSVKINNSSISNNGSTKAAYGSVVSWTLSDSKGLIYISIDGVRTDLSGDDASGSFTMPAKDINISVSGYCIAEGTLITLADGTQVPVEQLTGEEELLVWDLETGRYGKAPMVFIDSDAQAEYEIIHLFFSDGSDVEVISEHGFFDIGLGKYVYLDAENATANIGHRYIKQGGITEDTWETVTLTDVRIEHRVTRAFSPVTFGHLCYYVNGVLSMPGGIDGLFNIYDVNTETMRYDKLAQAIDRAKYGTFSYADFADLIPEEMYEAFNGCDLKVAMGKGLITWDDIAYLAKRYTPLAMDH